MKKTASLLLVALTVLMLFPLPSIATFEPYDLYATEPVNMRSGPGTQYEVIMELQTGESVFCFAKSGSWLEVAYYGKTGYVHSKYLSRERMLPGMILAAKTNANVRSGAGTSYSRVGKLKKGESLTYLGVSGKWYQVEYHGKTAYVHKSSVKFVQFDGEHVYLTLDDSKFFDNHYRDVYLGDYYDVSRRRVILVSGNANVQQLSDDVANLCGTDVDFVVKVSRLPIEMNKNKVMSLIKEMERRYNALTSSQKERCQLIRINWVPNIDTILVEIRGLDETNERLFRQWIADYSFLKIIEEEIYMPQ